MGEIEGWVELLLQVEVGVSSNVWMEFLGGWLMLGADACGFVEWL